MFLRQLTSALKTSSGLSHMGKTFLCSQRNCALDYNITLNKLTRRYNSGASIGGHIIGTENDESSRTKNAFGMITKRNIFTAQDIGINQLEKFQTYVEQHLSRAYGKHKTVILDSIKQRITQGDVADFTIEDLKNIIGCAKEGEHLDLLEKLIEVCHDKNPMFVRSKWSAATMRLYYKLDLPDRAYNAIKNTEKFGQFFHTFRAHQIAMTLLYDKGEYQKLEDLYQDSVKNIEVEGNQFRSIHLETLYCASLAKLNTPEALEKGRNLISQRKIIGMPKFVELIALLALNQGNYKLVLELNTGNEHKLVPRSMCIIANAKLGHFSVAMALLDEVRLSLKGAKRHVFSRVYDDSMKIESDDPKAEEFKSQVRQLKDYHFSDKSLEEVVFRSPVYNRPTQRVDLNQFFSNGLSDSEYRSNRMPIARNNRYA